MVIWMKQLCKILCSFCFFWHSANIDIIGVGNQSKYNIGAEMQMGNICCEFLWWSGKRRPSSQFWRMSCQSWTELECVLVHFHNEAKNPAARQTDRTLPTACSARAGAASASPVCKLGLIRVWAAMALKCSLPYVIVLLVFASLTCSCAWHKQNLSPKSACRAEHGILFCLLSKTLVACFLPFCSFRLFTTCKSLVFSKGWKEKKKKPKQPPSDCSLYWGCWHHTDPLWALRQMSPTPLPSREAAAGRESRFPQKQGRAEASQCADAFCEHMLN